MERFRVSFRNQVHTIGVREPGVLTVIACLVVRAPDGEPPERECRLVLGGLDSSNHHSLEWMRHPLEPGDRISIEVLPEGSFDPPLSSDGPIRLRDLGPAAKRPADCIEVELRDAVEELDWTLIEEAPPAGTPAPRSPSVPFVSTLPRPAVDPSSTNGMERFRVCVRGENHTIGVPGPGVLSAILTAVVRKCADTEPEHECTLDIGGIDSTGAYLDWPKYELQAGDHVEVQILPEGPFDPPSRTRTQAHVSEEHTENKRAWVRKTASDLGWTLIETPASTPS